MQMVRKYIVLVAGLIVFFSESVLAQDSAIQAEEAQDIAYLDDI